MSIKKPKKLPSSPGIYFFRRVNTILYIGKAVNIKKRLVSYFKKNAGAKAARLVREATKVNWIETKSEIEALLKEAELIKHNIPKYNIVMRDDKNYFYVGITNEKYPRIFLTHQIFQKKQKALGAKNINPFFRIGPFTSGFAIKQVLHTMRRLFPFCTCKETHKRPCVNAEIGRCPGYCCLSSSGGKTIVDEYQKNIRNIIAILSGRKKKLLQELKKEMRNAIVMENFERAAKMRDQMLGLENIFSHKLLGHEFQVKNRGIYDWDKIQKNIKNLVGTQREISRVEGYDISNISGAEATGSMVVFINGRSSKKDYRMFKIKMDNTPNDVAMHKEVMRRRLAHTEWLFPNLIVIDGGKAQLNATIQMIKTSGISSSIIVSALAKREEELYIEGITRPVPLSSLPKETSFFFQRVRNESHRFAKKYHHKRREIKYRPTA